MSQQDSIVKQTWPGTFAKNTAITETRTLWKALCLEWILGTIDSPIRPDHWQMHDDSKAVQQIGLQSFPRLADKPQGTKWLQRSSINFSTVNEVAVVLPT